MNIVDVAQVISAVCAVLMLGIMLRQSRKS
jgi:hypothetical protein